jgi:asparagine synthase (glutamine-hydrolysing)
MAGYGWIDALKDEANARISDEQFNILKPEWGNDIPDTKEAYWYRLMFDNVFEPHVATTVKRWIPSWGAPSDPYRLLRRR